MSSGGSVSSGGTTNSLGGSTSTNASDAGGVTAGCPTWPQNKLFPFVGVFFYGPDPRPCTVDFGNGVVQTFEYDASGQLVGSATADDTLITTYTFSDGRLSQQVDTSPTSVATYTMQYGAGTATYTLTGVSPYTATYAFDERGYPQTAVTVVPNPTPHTQHYKYTYNGCQMIARIAYDEGGTELTSSSLQYAYDAQGHLARMYSSEGTVDWRWDYSCR